MHDPFDVARKQAQKAASSTTVVPLDTETTTIQE